MRPVLSAERLGSSPPEAAARSQSPRPPRLGQALGWPAADLRVRWPGIYPYSEPPAPCYLIFVPEKQASSSLLAGPPRQSPEPLTNHVESDPDQEGEDRKSTRLNSSH